MLSFCIIQNNNTVTIHIHIHYRIVGCILIRRQQRIFLSKPINTHKPPQRRIVMTGTVVVPVQTVLRVKLLAVILVRLHIVRCREYPAERIVMVRFLNSPALADDHSIIALMVFQVVMVLAVSQSDIAFFCQQVLLISILIDHIPAIVRCGGRTACLMHRAKLCTISRIQIGIVFPFPNVTLLGKFKQLY